MRNNVRMGGLCALEQRTVENMYVQKLRLLAPAFTRATT
ncbi:hypothetical protein DWUX_2475 [Desulfovibrio diazotrophicus]|nr:hypothetical protein DWUX_2475 [Desulfovibrio diazotrophicus]